MSDSTRRVTLAIPTRNAGPEFPQILECMTAQELDGELEVLAIDSGSTDGTAEMLRNRDLRLIEIPPKEFNHGTTRNLAVREARSGRKAVDENGEAPGGASLDDVSRQRGDSADEPRLGEDLPFDTRVLEALLERAVLTGHRQGRPVGLVVRLCLHDMEQTGKNFRRHAVLV